MTPKRKRHDTIDSRLNRRAVELFQLGQQLLAEGYPIGSPRMNEVSLDLHRALNLRPWMPHVLDFEVFAMRPELYGPHADFALVQELHRKLVEAAA
jgi:hypothetical protein